MSEKICPFLSSGVLTCDIQTSEDIPALMIPCQKNCAFYDGRLQTQSKCLLSLMALNLANIKVPLGSTGNR